MNSTLFYKSLAKIAMKSTVLNNEERRMIFSGYKEFSKDQIYDFAKTRKILPFVSNLLIRLNLDTLFWQDIENSFVERNTAIVDILDKFFRKLSERGADKVFVFENFGTLLASNNNIACFASGDVDLYSDPSCRDVVCEVLMEENFIPKKSNHMVETVKTEFFNKRLFEKGFGINVMWQPLSRTKIAFPLKLDKILSWNMLYSYKNTAIKLPDKDVLMYLSLLHISIHGFHRSPDIRLYNDISNMSLLTINWDHIARFAKNDKTEVRTTVAAILANRLLDVKVPEQWMSLNSKKFRQINAILKRVYDAKTNLLKDEPNKYSVMCTEIISSDYTLFLSALGILFPPKEWINDFYLQGRGSLLKGYFLHLRNLL